MYSFFSRLISDLSGLSFGQDAEGNWGYKPSGADAVIPFNNPKKFFSLFEKISAKRDYYDAWISPSGGTITRDINTSGLYSGNILRVVRTQYSVLSFYALVPCYAKIYPDGEISEYQKDDLIFTVSSGGSDVLYTVEAIAK